MALVYFLLKPWESHMKNKSKSSNNKKIWYFVTKIVLTYCEKPLIEEKKTKLEAEGQEFAKVLRSLEQFDLTVKVQNKFW